MEEVRRTGGEDLGRCREEGRRRSGRRAEGLQGGAGEVQLGVLSEACCPKLGTFPPTPCGGGLGRGVGVWSSHFPTLGTPTPNPSPQGGGEQAEPAAHSLPRYRFRFPPKSELNPSCPE